MSVLSLNQIGLVRDPLLLRVDNLVFELVSLLNDIVLLGLHRSAVLIVATLLSKLCPDSIKFIDLKLLLIDNVVPLLDRLLEIINFFLPLFEFKDQVVKFLFQ